MARLRERVVSGAAQADTGQSTDIEAPAWARSATFFVDVSATAGTTPLFDLKLQRQDPNGQFRDMAGGDGSGAAGTGTSTVQIGQIAGTARGVYLIVSPDVVPFLGDGTNRQYNTVLTGLIRVIVTLDRTTGDETYTYTVDVEWHEH